MMEDYVITDEDNKQWYLAFCWWYHTSCLDINSSITNKLEEFPVTHLGVSTVFSNLRNGVRLSANNSKFLAAILDGSVKPLSGKQTALARAKKYAADSKIWQLNEEKTPHRKMLETLKSSGLVEKSFTMDALHQRLYRQKKDPLQIYFEADDKFEALYAEKIR